MSGISCFRDIGLSGSLCHQTRTPKSPTSGAAQNAQYPFVKEHALNHVRVPSTSIA